MSPGCRMVSHRLMAERRYKTVDLTPLKPNQIILINSQTIRQQLPQAYSIV
jgi:hypothetical protein